MCFNYDIIILYGSNKYKLLVIEEGDVVLVGRIMATSSVVHGRPLGKGKLSRGWSMLWWRCAMLPISNSDDNKILVRDAIGSFNSWPSQLN